MDREAHRHRRAAARGADEAPSDMGAEAARRCLADAGVDPSAVDLIVVACATPDQSQPAVACMIQQKLGASASQCPAFDVNSVCSGFVFALNVAQSMMLTAPRRFRNALVIGTDAFSKIMNWKDRRTCVFFGDGAGAVLLSHSEQPEDDGRQIRFLLGSDGRGRERHRGAGRRHQTGGHAGGARTRPEQVHHGRSAGVGLRGRRRAANDPRAARGERPVDAGP
jgi:3-oxoacyl-[acyl-carrier-protein] synthase-3